MCAPVAGQASVLVLGCRSKGKGTGDPRVAGMEDGKFTMFAGKAVALAEVFKFTLGQETFVGPSICRLELSAPTEQSTDGGRLAVQHVSIVPENGGPTTVMATLYQVQRRAEARPYEVVGDSYKKRFHTNTFPVSTGQFDEMMKRLKAFFQQFEFKFELAPLTGAGPPARPPTAGTLPVAHAGPPTDGALPVAKRPTGPLGVPMSGSAARPGGSRTWLIIVTVALVAAVASGLAVYLLGQ
jgi:hypothetical protein